jgi:hypothetical protein
MRNVRAIITSSLKKAYLTVNTATSARVQV